MSNLKKAICLVCISSLHGACNYCWKVISGSKREFPKSPVVYVNKGGLYQCTVTYESRRIVGRIISVEVLVGKLQINIDGKY